MDAAKRAAYALTLDEGSRWHAAGIGGLPAEETVTAQYWALARLAAEAGFEHYEVSNYARPGFRSRHNQRYWRREEYLALGPGACGFLGRVRYGNVKPVERYCTLVEAGRLPLHSHEVLTERQALAERLILGLRTSDGIPAERLEHIWNGFSDANNLNSSSKGPGMGLALTRFIVRAHGGRVEANSKYGAGSTFSIYLPIALEEAG